MLLPQLLQAGAQALRPLRRLAKAQSGRVRCLAKTLSGDARGLSRAVAQLAAKLPELRAKVGLASLLCLPSRGVAAGKDAGSFLYGCRHHEGDPGQ